MNIKINAADSAFSLAVRWRAGFFCECCGKSYQPGTMGLHCSHLFSRRSQLTRYDPDNAVAHCYGCHQRLGGSPLDFARWAELKFGVPAMDKLRLRAHLTYKRPKSFLPLIAKHYREQAKILESYWLDGPAFGRPDLPPFQEPF